MSPAPLHDLKRRNARLEPLVLIIISGALIRVLNRINRQYLVYDRNITLKAHPFKPAHTEVFHDIYPFHTTSESGTEHPQRPIEMCAEDARYPSIQSLITASLPTASMFHLVVIVRAQYNTA